MTRQILMLVFLLGFLWGSSWNLSAQQGQTPVTPLAKCIVPFLINSTGTGSTGHFQPSTTGYDNRQTGCSNWSIVYSSTGYTVISLVLQSAPALSNTAPGTPGTYVTFAGTVVTGINGNTSITQASSTFAGFYPWIRIDAATLTGSGTVVGVLIGTVPIDVTGGSSSTSGGCVGTVATPCIVSGPIADGSAVANFPVRIGGKDGSGNTQDIITDTGGRIDPAAISTALVDAVSNTANLPSFGGAAGVDRNFPFVYNGSTWDRDFICSNQASFNLSGAGDTQIIAASGSTTIRICHLSFSTTAPEDIKITRGTGANCATGTTDVSGLYKSVQSAVFNWESSQALRGAASGAICLNQTAAQALGGIVIYAQF